MLGNVLGLVSRVPRQVALVMMAVWAVGCGGDGDQKSASIQEPVEAVHVVHTGETPSGMLPVQTGLTQGEAEVVPSADSLPPDIVTSVSETVVEPGTAIEITAEGSADVREVILSDGIGRTQSFVYDLEAKSWRTFYRVPMRVQGERLGLSVTAKNDGNRWRRVWLFLDIQRERIPADSASTQP
jgi:hypothetical protein